MRIVICLIFLMVSFNRDAYSQDVDLKFRKIVYCAIDSFKSINIRKYKRIRSVEIKSDTLGSLTDFKINFNSDKVGLTKFEYRWFWMYFKKYNYTFLKAFYSAEELETVFELKGRIRFIESAVIECHCHLPDPSVR